MYVKAFIKLIDFAMDSTPIQAWPFMLAQDVLHKIGNKVPAKGYVLFSTGYGPSGLPHIGTYCEVVRTKMVQNAFAAISGGMPSKLIVVSDDMDGLRKIPENMPNAEMLKNHLQKPLTSIPDPFSTHQSYGAHMNAKCQSFLDKFGFDYEFLSSTDLYKKGIYDEFLLKALAKYDEIMNIMVPTLGEERQKTYSPFLPICPRSGKVLYVAIVRQDLNKGTITYIDESTSEEITIPVTGGNCKLQWKPDFGMRWAALDVDFEMYGKDHLANSTLYTKICQTIGGRGPSQFCYEMFLDEHGRKISKSAGNGLSVEEWLTYAPIESLAFYMYQSPRKAKKLYFDVIPKHVDDYIRYVIQFHNESENEKLKNPVWHINNGAAHEHNLYGISFSLLLNLACVCNPNDKSVLWGFIAKYAPNATPAKAPFLDQLAEYAVRYYNDFIKPKKIYRPPSAEDFALLDQIKIALETISHESTSEEIQNMFYRIGMASHYKDLRDFFRMIYETLLGQTQGPRLGSFIKLYGIDQTIELINALKR